MGFAKAPPPKVATPRPAPAAPKREPRREEPRPVFHSSRSLLDIPVSDPRVSNDHTRAFSALRHPCEPLPHRAQIESSFGRDLSAVEAHVGGSAGAVVRDLGANAFTIGDQIAFREAPSLRLAAHEAAHVVQQFSGLRSPQEICEQHANAVAARVVAGQSAAHLLPQQRTTTAIPSLQYDKGTPTQTELDEYFIGILEHWEEQSESLPIGADRAYARRVWLLLSFRPNTSAYDDIDAFLTTCLEIAKDEDKTVEHLKQQPSVDFDFMVDNGEAFPNWWANRIYSELYGTSNESTLALRAQEARKNALLNTALISDEIWWRGLPISKQQAAQLRRGAIPQLALSFENARKYPNERIGKYAGMLVTWERTFHHYMLVHWFRFQLGIRVDQIRKGEIVIDEDNWKNVMATKFFHIKLKVFESAASTPDDMRAAFSALMLQMPQRFFRDPYGGGFKYEFPQEAIDAFWKEIQEVDRQIAGTSGEGRIWQAFEWAYERSYFGEAALEIYDAIKENWPWMVAKLVAVFIAQFIPGVNVLVDVALLIEFGWDALTSLVDLVDTFKSAYDAQTVDALQRASAKMAGTFVGLGAKIVMWALTAGARWGAKKIAKYRDGKKFLDEEGDTPENRDLLAKTKGDIKEARKLLAARREQERRAREKAAAEKRAEEKRQREQEEELRQERDLERQEQERQERQRELLDEERARVERKAVFDQIRAKRNAEDKARIAERNRKEREENSDPNIPVVLGRPIKPIEATPTRYWWRNPKDKANHILGTLSSDGTLRIRVYGVGQLRVGGAKLVDMVFQHFGNRVKRFEGEWNRDGKYNRNYNEYMQNLQRMSPADAARGTWIGRDLTARGFTNVVVRPHGTDPNVVVPVFTRP